jgi:hypothetical protein
MEQELIKRCLNIVSSQHPIYKEKLDKINVDLITKIDMSREEAHSRSQFYVGYKTKAFIANKSKMIYENSYAELLITYKENNKNFRTGFQLLKSPVEQIRDMFRSI